MNLKMTEAQKHLYHVAENMKMQKKISDEGYEHFQMAIKALAKEEQQESVLDKIEAEIDIARFIDKDTKLCKNANASGLEIALQIIDKYKVEVEPQKNRANEESIIDKIRTEIEQNAYPIVHGVNNHELGMTLYGILQVFDKYKSEIEPQMGGNEE